MEYILLLNIFNVKNLNLISTDGGNDMLIKGNFDQLFLGTSFGIKEYLVVPFIE